MLTTLWPELRICAETADGHTALQAFREHSPQILFLDIQMPGSTGLEVAQHASGRAHVVFISAYDQYAMEAFERGALDYLQKPIIQARLQRTIERIRDRLRSPPSDLSKVAELLRSIAQPRPDYLKWLTVPRGQELRLVTVEEICFLRADDKYTSVFTAEAEFLLSSTLKQVREKLDPRHFWQIHRSTVVNIAAIQAVYRTFRGALEIKLKRRPEVLAVSAAHAHLFKHL